MKKLLCLTVGLGLTLSAPLVGKSCASLEVPGYYAEVANEEAIIVWDAQMKIQHFIRRADFNASSPSVGFLVPTPNTPQLSEADNAAFQQIEDWMKPKVVYQAVKVPDYTPFIFGRRRDDMDTATTATTAAVDDESTRQSVEVVERKRVAGYDAAVLSASDTTSLNHWLKQNKYLSSPELMTWLQPYIARGWKVTAFKIASKDGEADSGTVKMSFSTPRPFFPYREPEKKRQSATGERLLRVYLVAKQRMDGAIQNKVWPGRTPWTDSVPAQENAPFAKQLGLASNDLSGMRVTTLEDRSQVRVATDDVYFQAAFDQSRIVPPPIIEPKYERFWIPIDLVLLASALLSAAFFALTRRIRPVKSLDV